MKKLNWGILGTGWIATEMAEALNRVNGEIYAVCDTTLEAAKKYAKRFGVQKAYGSADEMIDDKNVDIVYIATPHNLHYRFLVQSLKAGKHVFCEKAITVNDSQLEEAVAIAKEKNLVICDGVTLFHMPLFKKLKGIVDSGVIGEVKMVQVNFGSCKEYDVTNRFFSKELAGGALLDIGVYALSFVRWFMNEKPNQVLSQVKYAPSGVDEQVGILLTNPSSEMATITLSLHSKQPKRGLIAFDKDILRFMNIQELKKL